MAPDIRRLQPRLTAAERRSWIVPAVLIAASVILLELVGLFEPFDDLAYDWALRLVASRAVTPAEVLLIDTGQQPGETAAEDLLALLELLEDLQPRHVAWALPVPPQVADRCRGRQEVTIGQSVIRDRIDRDVFHFAVPPPSGARGWPVVVLPLPRHGIYREQLTKAMVAGSERPALESAIAARLRLPTSDDQRFRIRFRGGTGSLPHVTLPAALQGGLVPELVAGKVVLIGEGSGVSPLGMSTPTTREDDQMSVLEFHGQALNTLLTSSAVNRTNAALNWLIYVAVAIAAGLLFESTTARGCGVIWLGLLAGNAVCLPLLLWATNTWFPAFEMAAVQSVCFVRVTQRRNAFAHTAWQQLIQDLYAKLRQRRWPTGFFSEEEPWSQIVSFVHQTLNLNRLIILELPADNFHVREVKALNCSLADISEQRRDHRRWPYVAALEERRAVSLDENRPFLQLHDGEQQYLVPLVFGGEVFGFMALGVARRELGDTAEFESRLAEYGDQIGELLYRRHRILADRQRERSWFGRFRQSADARIYTELVHATHLLERRAARLENMFHKSLTAAAIYDVFGRLIMVNAKMAQLLQNEGVVAADLSTVDLITLLTKQDQQAARNMLRQVVTCKRHESVAVTLDHQQGDYLFNVRPMELEVPESQASSAAASPLQLQGILCELVDRSDVLRTHRLRAQLTEGFGNALRNDFAAVDLATTLVADDSLPADQRLECAEMIHGRVQAALRSLEEFEQLMPADLYGATDECLPIAPEPVLEEAIKAAAIVASDRGIEIQLATTPLTSHTFVAPNLLPQVFEAILDFLLLDARDDSQLIASLVETPDEVVVAFANEGFGVAINSVQELLDQDGLANVPESRHLRDALDWVHSWGGRMTASSEIGAGTSINLILRKFQ